MVTIYDTKKNILKNGKCYILCELRGLSSDEKPIKIKNNLIENGSVFIEMDTQDIYFYDIENEEWLNPNVDDTTEEQVGE